MRFFISNTFISNASQKLIKNQANAKQYPKAELWLFENYSHSPSTLSSKNNRCVCIHEIIIIIKMKRKKKK